MAVFMATTDDPYRKVPGSAESTPLNPREYVAEGGPPLYGAVAVSKRISWGAIFAGVVMALVTQLAFSLLGFGLGASAFDPYDTQSAGNWGIGTAIYTLLSVLVSLFIGGHVAGRLAGFPHQRDGILHGLVTFGLTTLVGFYLLTSGLGAIIGGAGSLISSVVSAAGQGAASAAPGLVNAAKQTLQNSGVDLSGIQGQVDELSHAAGNPQNQASNADLMGLITRAFQNPGGVSATDHEALINAVMSRTGKSHSDAEQVVNGFEQTYKQAQAKAQQIADQAKAQAQQAADAARKGAAKGGFAATVALLLGALAAALGGRSGTPRDLIEVTKPGRP